MTAIVTADQIVPALTTDLASSTEAEKTALRTALGVTTGGSGGGGSGGGTVSSATNFFTEISSERTFTSSSVGPFGSSVVTQTVWATPLSTADFGTFNSGFTVFTFTTSVVATVSYGISGYLQPTGSLPANWTLQYRLRIGGAGGVQYYGGADGRVSSLGLLIADGGGSMTRQFNVGDTIEIVMVAQSDNNTGVSGKYGFVNGLPGRSYWGISSH